MTVHFITASRGGDEPHVKSADDARQNVAHIGNIDYVGNTGDKLAASMTNTNTLQILSGDGWICGHHWSVEGFENVTIENGNPGYNRKDLVVFHAETSPSDDGYITVIKGEETTGEAVVPAHTEGDLNDGDTVAEMPLYVISLEGVNVGEPEPQFQVLVPYNEFRDSISPLFQTRSLSTSVSINANNGANLSIDVPVIDGYTFVGVVGFNSSSWECCFASARPNGNAIAVSLFNNASSKMTPTIRVNALYIAAS